MCFRCQHKFDGLELHLFYRVLSAFYGEQEVEIYDLIRLLNFINLGNLRIHTVQAIILELITLSFEMLPISLQFLASKTHHYFYLLSNWHYKFHNNIFYLF